MMVRGAHLWKYLQLAAFCGGRWALSHHLDFSLIGRRLPSLQLLQPPLMADENCQDGFKLGTLGWGSEPYRWITGIYILFSFETFNISFQCMHILCFFSPHVLP